MVDFSLKAHSVVDSLDTVPEAFRGAYIDGTGEHAGKKVVNPALTSLLQTYEGAYGSLNEERNKVRKLNEESAGRRTALSKFTEMAQSLGLSVEDGADLAELLKGHIDGLTDKVKGGTEAKINLEKINKDWDGKLKAAVGAADAKTAKMQTSLERYLIGQEATAQIAAHDGIPMLLMPHVTRQTKVVVDGDEFVARVVDAQGDLRVNAAGAPMTVKDLVAEMKANAEYAPAFKSPAKGGSGTGKDRQQDNTRRTPAQRTNAGDGEKRTAQQKIEDGLNKRASA